MPSREEMDAQLAARTEESYASRDTGGQFQGVFRSNVNPPLWVMDKGPHLFDIVLYQAGNADPVLDQDKWAYWLDIATHRNVGPSDLQFVCLRQTFNEACPICEYRNEVFKRQPEGERQQEAHKKKLQELNYSRRAYYNVWVQDTNEQIAKGRQVLEIAHWFMEKHLSALAKIDRRSGGGYISFAHPGKQGKTISCNRTGVGAANTGYDGYKFLDRDYEIPDDILEDALKLDELIHFPTYQEVADAFWDEGSGKGREQESDEQAAAPETEPTPRGRGRTVDEEPAGRGRSTGASDRQPAADDDGVSDGVEDRGTAIQVDPPETAPAPRKRKRPSEETVVDPAPRGRGRTMEDEPAPRGRGRAQGQEEAPAPRSSGLRKLGGADASAVQAAKPTPKYTCPVPSGKFGEDNNAFDECENCALWDPCVQAKADNDIPY